MDIELQARLLKLKGFLNEINHISYTYSQFGKRYPMNSLNEIEAEKLVKVYNELLNQVKSLILNYDRQKRGRENETSNNNNKYNKEKKIIKEKENFTSKDEKTIKVILDMYNSRNNTKYKTLPYKNVLFWLETYKLDEILQAVGNIKYHRYWSDKMTPAILFRQRNPRGEPVDYIGELLNTKRPLQSDPTYKLLKTV